MAAVSNSKVGWDILAPPTDGEVVVPSDTTTGLNEFTKFARSLWIGVTGNVTVVTTGGSVLQFTNVPVGMLNVQCKQVRATGTSATGILALW